MSGTAIYNLLGIKPSATQDEIKAAYREKAKERHPDHNPDDPEASDRFQKIKKAYDLLSDESTRKDWHKRYNLPWLWEKPAEPEEELPPEGLNRACIACSTIAFRCTMCRIGICVHFGVMLKLEGHLPKPVCINCKKRWEDGRFSDWKMKQLIKEKFGRAI